MSTPIRRGRGAPTASTRFGHHPAIAAACPWAAGASTELHVRPGLPHGFDNYALGAHVTERAMADRVQALCSL